MKLLSKKRTYVRLNASTLQVQTSTKKSAARGLYCGFSRNRRNKLLMRPRRLSMLFAERPRLSRSASRSTSSMISFVSGDSSSFTVHCKVYMGESREVVNSMMYKKAGHVCKHTYLHIQQHVQALVCAQKRRI